MSEHSHRPGTFPEVHDEAPPTPGWVPLLGLAILALGSLFVVYRVATAPEEEAQVEIAAPAGEVGEEAAAPAAPAAQPPAAPAARPAVAPAAQPAAPAAGADAFGRQPGAEHFGHDHP